MRGTRLRVEHSGAAVGAVMVEERVKAGRGRADQVIEVAGIVRRMLSVCETPKDEQMGKHGRQVDCSACKGSGEQKIGRNGKTDTVPCQVCKGTGKV